MMTEHHKPTTPAQERQEVEAVSFSDCELAIGAAAVRTLRAAIVFAQSEPEFFPAAFDPDTGLCEPVPNYAPGHRVFCLAIDATRHPAAAQIMADAGWTKDTCYGDDWPTMLSRLPPS